MEYGDLIRDAWRMTWRPRFLWIFGLFGGGTTGFSFGNGGNVGSLFDGDGDGDGGGGRSGSSSPFDGGMSDAGRWLGDNTWLIVTAVLLLVLVMLALWVLSVIMQGGLTGATVELGSGRPSTFRSAFRTGRRLFWRNVGLSLVLFMIVVVVIALVGTGVGAAVWLAMSVEQTAWVIIPAVLVGLVVFALCVVGGIALSIVVPFAIRAIFVLDVGPLSALRDGWRVLRSRPSVSIIVWLLAILLGLGTSLVVTAVAVFLLLVLALPVLIVWFGFQPEGATALSAGIAYGVAAGILWFGVLLFLSAIANTFHWNYWTLAYLRLRSDVAASPVVLA